MGLKTSIRQFYHKNNIHLFRLVIPFKRYKSEDSIIISSETRGGSTWLMELLHSAPNTIINWEPLHEIKGVVPEKYKWGERPYIPEDYQDKDGLQLMGNILKFKRYSKNSLRYVTLKDMLIAKQVLTKMVRSNLMLPWLTKNFVFKHKPIYLLRHPVAVAKSQFRNIPESHKENANYIIPDTLNNERYIENSDYLDSLKTTLERQVALWCIHNMDVINHPMNDKKWVVVYYEELLLNPDIELQRIGKEINLEIPFDESLVNKPSRSDFFNEYQNDKKKQLSKWMNGLSQKELRNLQLVFDHYNLKIYSADNIMPLEPRGSKT